MHARTMIPRVIPCLLLKDNALVKTVRFKSPVYVGDPRIAVKIFNQKEVDELLLLDISATRERRSPPFELIEEIASECFMPLGYGGGIRCLEDIERLFAIGLEKVVINSALAEDPELIQRAATRFGSQSIVASIDAKRDWFGNFQTWIRNGRQRTRQTPVGAATRAATLGAGEVLITSMDRDGTMAGYDVELIRAVSDAVRTPVIACGGAGTLADFGIAIKAGAAAVSAGSLFVYHGKHRAVLINYPERAQLRDSLLAHAIV